MKKIIITIALTAAFTILFAATALAVDATVDTANGSKGLVTVTLKNWDKDKDDVRIIIQKDGKNLDVFNPVKANSTIPITFGKGEYEIMVGVNMGGGRLSVKTKVKVNVSAPDEKLWYTTSNAKVDFASSTKAVPNLKKLSDGKKTEREKATPIYEYIVTNFTYDHDLASKIIAGTVTSYVPIIDTVYDMKKAICYGYSVVFAGAVRNI
ncbi:MAG: transglutaminase-like domain-containing protein, partial [Defluviitaleaceae bacterium]|nr:transglutaminase-like domain-containing protein [Defluviitaleaceae bacterium]